MHSSNYIIYTILYNILFRCVSLPCSKNLALLGALLPHNCACVSEDGTGIRLSEAEAFTAIVASETRGNGVLLEAPTKSDVLVRMDLRKVKES